MTKKSKKLDPLCEKTYELFLSHVREGYSAYSFTKYLYKESLGFKEMKSKFKNVELICKAMDRRKQYKKTFQPIVYDPVKIIDKIIND